MPVQALEVTVTVTSGGMWPETWTLHEDFIHVEYPDGSDHGYAYDDEMAQLVEQLCSQQVVDNPVPFKGISRIYVELRKIDGEWKGA